MDMNIIKEYLVGIGFKINDESVKNAEQTISNVQDNIKKFADNNKENLSSTQNFIGTFGKYMKENLGIVSKILPEAKAPLLQIIGLAESLYKNIDKGNKGLKDVLSSSKEKEKPKKIPNVVSDKKEIRTEYINDINTKESQNAVNDLIKIIKELNNAINSLSKDINNINKVKVNTDDVKKATSNIKELDKESSKANKTLNKINNKNIKVNADSKLSNLSNEAAKGTSNFNSKINSDDFTKPMGKIKESIGNVSKESSSAAKSLEGFKEVGGNALKSFAEGATISIGLVAAGVVALVTAAVGAMATLTSLAKQDLGYQKLAMQLWTTKENAREIDMALKTMKVSMQDLWLSPELLQQFNQLRQDSAQLKLPSDYEDNLKIVRSVIFEFQRLKQEGVLVFQWIGYYISKYAAGPLAEFHQALKSFNDWILRNIPNAGKIIGSILGIIFRLLSTLIEVFSSVAEPIIYFIKLIGDGLNSLPGPIQNLIKLIGIVGAAIMAGPVGAIILLLIALDDVFTYLRGGKSIIGNVFGYLGRETKDAINTLKSYFQGMKDSFHKNIVALKDDWDYYWNKAKEIFQNLEDKAKKVGDKIKEALKPLQTKISDFFGNFGVKNTPEAQSALKDFSSKISQFSSNHGFQLPSFLTPNNTTNKNSTTNNKNTSNVTNNFNVYGSDNPNSTANVINSKINTSIKTRNLQGVT